MIKQNNYKNMLKCVYLLLCFVLFSQVFLILFQSYPKATQSTWQESASYDFKQEEVIENGEKVVYNLISTPEQLAGALMGKTNQEGVYADNHNTYFTSTNKYKLTNSINLSGKSWTPTTNTSLIDGNYFTISNLSFSYSSEYVGFVTKNSGTIQNIIFENLSVTNSYSAGAPSGTGGIAGYNTGTIKNCVVKGSVFGNSFGSYTYNGTSSNNYDRRTGGIVGYNYSGTITNCTNYAKINYGKFCGGIVGYQRSGKITKCLNYGTINCNQNVYPRLGGIVGEVAGGTLKQCLNYGNVDNYYNGSYTSITDLRAGGIAGMTKVAISECGNEATITGSYYQVAGWPTYPNKSYVGGIAGYSTSTFKNCYNTGSINAQSVSILTLSEHYKMNIYGEYEDVINNKYYNYNGTEYEYKIYYDYLVYGENSMFHVRILNLDDGINKKVYTLDDKYGAYSYGIGYTTSTSSNTVQYCYNTGNIYGGNSTKTIYEFNNLYCDNGYFKNTEKFSLSITFNNGRTDYGYISNTDKYSYCYFINNSEDTSRGVVYNNKTYNYATALSEDIEKSLNDTTQRLKIRKASNSNAVYVYINDENNNDNLQENLIQVAGNITNFKYYFTFDTKIYTHTGTNYSTLSALKNDVNRYFPSSSWKTASNVNNGERPFLTELYWQYDLDNDSE